MCTHLWSLYCFKHTVYTPLFKYLNVLIFCFIFSKHTSLHSRLKLSAILRVCLLASDPNMLLVYHSKTESCQAFLNPMAGAAQVTYCKADVEPSGRCLNCKADTYGKAARLQRLQGCMAARLHGCMAAKAARLQGCCCAAKLSCCRAVIAELLLLPS